MPNQNKALGLEDRLLELLKSSGQKRHGAGAYLAKRYGVATVTANDWLNGKHKPSVETAEQIAKDHGSTFDYLYFGKGGDAENGVAEQQSRYGTDEIMGLYDQLTPIEVAEAIAGSRSDLSKDDAIQIAQFFLSYAQELPKG